MLAGAVVAVHGSTVQYGRDGRTYMLFTLLASLSMLGLVLDRREPSRARWALWVLTGAAAIYVHLFVALVLVVQAAVLLPAFGSVADRRRRIVGFVAIGALVAPLLLVVASRGELERQGLSPLGPYILRDVTFALAGGEWFVAVPVALAFVAAAVAVLRLRPAGVAPARAEVGDLRLLLLWVVAPTVLAIALSLPERVFEARYVLPSMVPLAVLLAWLADRRADLVRPAAVALVVLSLAGGIVQFGVRNEDWRDLTATMTAEAQPGDGVVFLDDFHVLVVEHYLAREGFDPPAPTDLDSVVPVVGWGAFHIADWEVPDVSEAEFECAVAGRSRLWVLERDGAADLDGRYPMLEWAEARFGPGEVRFADDVVRLHLFAAPTPPVPGASVCGAVGGGS